MFSKASTKAKENRRVKKVSLFYHSLLLSSSLSLFLKQRAVAAEIQETVVVVDQVYWIS
jgi:hypothetical protein